MEKLICQCGKRIADVVPFVKIKYTTHICNDCGIETSYSFDGWALTAMVIDPKKPFTGIKIPLGKCEE